MNVSLPPEILAMIEDFIRSKKYDSAEHVITAAVVTLEQQHRLDDADFKKLYPDINQLLAEGLAASEAGEVIDGDAFFDQLDREEEEELAKERKTA